MRPTVVCRCLSQVPGRGVLTAFLVTLFGALASVAGAGTSAAPAGTALPQACGALPSRARESRTVSSVAGLVAAVRQAGSGSAVLIEDGVYHLKGATLVLATPGVTLRAAGGDREKVVLDGDFQSPELVQISASGVTVADLTLRNARQHPIHVLSRAGADTLDTLIYNVHLVDPGEQAIKINVTAPGHYPDRGVVACSRIELTDRGRPRIRNNCYTGGIDAHAARGWQVRDNVFEGFWCSDGLSEHAVHFWMDSQDTVVERNAIRNCARGIGFGMLQAGTSRSQRSESAAYYDHEGGVIRNNMIWADDSRLFASRAGFDSGIALWQANRALVLHNTIFATQTGRAFAGIDARFSGTRASIFNNLSNLPLKTRGRARTALGGNLVDARAQWFADPAAGDLHLRRPAPAPLFQGELLPQVSDDFDREMRPAGRAGVIGADQI